MALETFPYDTADYLTDARSIAGYLEAELDEDEMPYMASALATVIRARGGVEKVSAETGLSTEQLLSATREDGSGDRETVVRVMETYRSLIASPSLVA